MIDAIQLRNFRGFRAVGLELKPLTVLLGPNSSGKSSFGHALAALSFAHKAHGSSNKPSLSPLNTRDAELWPVDLGGLKDLRTTGVDDRVYIGLHTKEGWVEFGFGLKGEDDIRLSYLSHPVGLNVSTANVIGTGIVPAGPAGATSEGVQFVTTASPEAATPKLELTRMNEVQWKDREVPVTVGLEGFVLLTVRHEGGTEVLLSGGARDEIRSVLENLTYLRATRQKPTRGYLSGRGDRQAIGYSGEWTATVLQESMDKVVQYCVAPPVPESVEEATSRIGPWEFAEAPLGKALDEWLTHLELASSVNLRRSTSDPGRYETRVTLEKGGEAHDITEVGLGVSQILPVLVAGLTQQSDGIYIVDLPEAHLHPRPQAAVADFFCSLALSGRSMLVETHSEMFFHRLRLRAEMNSQLAERIAVYFIDPPKKGFCSHPRKVGLGFDGELQWPPRFLQEAWENESQIAAVRGAKRSVSR